MPMTATRAPFTVSRYATALLLSLAVALLQLRMEPLLSDVSLLLALPAVVAAAWFGGLGPGLVAAIVPLVIVAWWVSPARMLDISRPVDIVRVGLFVATAVLVCITMRHLRRSARDERRRRTEVERRLQGKAVLEAVVTAVSTAPTTADVTRACASALMRGTGAAASAIALIPTGGGDAEVVQAFGYEAATTGRIDLTSNGAIATSLQSGEVVAIPRLDPALASFDCPLLLKFHETVVLIPLAVPGRLFGVVLLGFDQRRVVNDEERGSWLEAGHQTAQMLERARAYDRAEHARVEGEAYRVRAEAEIRERRRAEAAHQESEARYRALAARTHRLYSLSAALSEAVTLEAVAKAVVRQGRSVVGAAAGTVALCVEGDAFETLYAEDYPPPVVEAWLRFAAEPGLCTTAAVTSRTPVLVASFADWQQQYPRSAETAADGGFTSTASLPLLVDNAPIGVLSFHFTAPISFDPEYQALLTSVAHHAAQAIDRARLYETTERARLEAEAANRAKDDFLSIVSHELRTPLNAILGWGAMLRDGALDHTRVERAMEAIVSNATRQARLIDDLLEVSRIVAGRVSLDLQELELADVVRGAVEAMLPTAAQRGVDLRVDQLPTARVIADPHRLDQVFGNLLTNAVKFTPTGGRVTVDGMLDSGSVRVRVMDTGCGIDPDVLPRIFERFHQGNSTTARSVGGLGLGLFIARRLAEALQGQVLAESAGKDAGATFTVALPVATPSLGPARTSRSANTAAPRGARPSLSGIHVLVVDDENDARDMMSAALECCGAAVTVAGSTREALVTLATLNGAIQVLLADLAMPDEDGYALIQYVRSHADAMIAHLPAAAVSACAREDERQRALAAGFQLHLAKPVAPDVLANAVARLAGMIPAHA